MASTPIRFVGNHDFSSQGKFMWEILCQLRNMGIGRYVTKTEWLQKWPNEPSYLKIIKARPGMDRWMHTGKLWAEWTFRGQKLGIYEFSKDLNRSDWKLIHKHEEKQFLDNPNKMKDIVFPDSIPLPPLQIQLSKKDAVKNGQQWSEDKERIPLELSIDPQFEMLKPFIKQVPPQRKSKSIYDEVDSESLLELYGDLLPVKLEAWGTEPAKLRKRFAQPEC
uniref:28S ribosomal protein S34, mitochondrial n=1 Tax=Panagrolaimus sp. JU765 TaxID=591449 RepID=A0AC34QPF0_9BILA